MSRSSSEIMDEIHKTEDEIEVINTDLKNMGKDKTSLDILISVSNTLKTNIENYDLSSGGEWEGDLYANADTQKTACISSVEKVNGDFSNTKTELATAETNANNMKKELEDKVDRLWDEYYQALAEESATSYGY